MITHPHLATALARERQRDLLARAAQQRLARHCRAHARPPRHTAPARPRMPRFLLRRSRPAALAL